MPQPSRDFRAKLREQLEFLESSCFAYDAGRISEAVRIAMALRICFHDGKNSRSILGHLNETTRVRMLTTSQGVVEEGKVTITGLTWITYSRLDDSHFFEPMLDGSVVRNLVSLDQWWNHDQIFLVGPSAKISRRKLVLDIANKDGGAHVDATLSDDHIVLNEGAGITAEIALSDTVETLPHKWAAEATLRQIGWEVLHTPDIRQLAGLSLLKVDLTGTS